MDLPGTRKRPLPWGIVKGKIYLLSVLRFARHRDERDR